MVAGALFAILWVANVRGPGMGWFPILLYVLFIGNLTTPIMNRLAPLSSRLRFPQGLDRVPDTFVPDGGRDRIVDGSDRHARVSNSHQLLFLATVERR